MIYHVVAMFYFSHQIHFCTPGHFVLLTERLSDEFIDKFISFAHFVLSRQAFGGHRYLSGWQLQEGNQGFMYRAEEGLFQINNLAWCDSSRCCYVLFFSPNSRQYFPNFATHFWAKGKSAWKSAFLSVSVSFWLTITLSNWGSQKVCCALTWYNIFVRCYSSFK
jgi:hypothetical protein